MTRIPSSAPITPNHSERDKGMDGHAGCFAFFRPQMPSESRPRSFEMAMVEPCRTMAGFPPSGRTRLLGASVLRLR